MATNDELLEQNTRHAVLVQRYAGGLSKEYAASVESLIAAIRDHFADLGDKQTQKAINELIKQIRRDAKPFFDDYTADLLEQLSLFGVDESQWQGESLETVVVSPAVSLEIPAPAQVIGAAASQPLVFPDSNDTIQLEPFIRGWTQTEIRKVEQIIRTGVTLGQTNAQIERALIGVGGQVSSKSKRNNEAIVRTATNHVSTVARETTLRQNRDIVIGYRWISTLDNRTTSQCKSLDQRVFKWGDRYQPKPPFHPNCRSTTVPELDGRFKFDDDGGERPQKGAQGPGTTTAGKTYYSWLKTQPAAFQDDTIGPTRGALLRNGGLTADEFAKLNVDQKYRPITLAEMRDKAPQAFDKAGIALGPKGGVSKK